MSRPSSMSKLSCHLVAAAVVLSAAPLYAQPKVVALEAEIETTYTLPDGRQIRNHGHFYRSQDGRVREDLGRGAIIADIANGTVTLLSIEKKEARIITIPPEKRALTRREQPLVDRVEQKRIAGHQIAKVRTKGPQGENQEFWTAKDLGIVTWSRVESAGLATTRALQNISVREPDPQVFQVPSDYTVIDEPMPPEVASALGTVPTRFANPLGGSGVRMMDPVPSSNPAPPRR